MKKFKAVLATILMVAVLLTVTILTWNAPRDSDNIPIIPAYIGVIIVIIGFWESVFGFYHFMEGSTNEKTKKNQCFNNLILYPLPKLLNSWEVGSFETKESKKDYTSFTFYVNSDIVYAVFMPNDDVEDYKKVLTEVMGYKEFKKVVKDTEV